jgi:hypothetical protein
MGFNKRYVTIEKVITASNDSFLSLEKLFDCDTIMFTGGYSEVLEEIQNLVREKNYIKIKEVINNL